MLHHRVAIGSKPIRPTRAREGIYREGTNVPPPRDQIWDPSRPQIPFYPPSKGSDRRAQICSTFGPLLDQFWVKMGQKWVILAISGV